MKTERDRLTGAKRRHLRKLAHGRKPVVHVGEAGLSEPLYAALDKALATHELVKVKLLSPEDKKAIARDLALRCNAELCGLVGHMVLLYRENPEGPKIEFPG